MKYILLFEAFKSEILSGVLKHLSNESREGFKKELKRLSETIDFPMSEFSDDMFQYVPNIVDKAKKIGTEADRKDDTIFKFWFDINGNFINKSLVRESTGHSKDGYKVVREISSLEQFKEDIKSGEIKTGDKFWINLESGFVLATILVEKLYLANGELKSTNIFMIQDSNDGNPPDSPGYVASYSNTSIESEETESDGTVTFNFTNGVTFDTYPDWKSWGKYSWMLAYSDDFRGVAEKLEKDDDVEVDLKKNLIYTNKNLIYTNDYGLEIVGIGFDDVIKNAHFAIVLDLDKLKSTDYKKRGETRKERSELKSGVITKDIYDQIKSLNVNRYLDKLSQSITVDADLQNLDTIFWKLFNKKLLLNDVLFKLDPVTEFERTFSRIIYFIKEKEYKNEPISQGRTEELLKSIVEPIKRIYKSNADKSSRFMNSEKFFRNRLNSNSVYPEIREKVLEFVDKYMKLIDDFSGVVAKLPKETIDDYEIILTKLNSVYSFFNRSTYSAFRLLLVRILDNEKMFYSSFDIGTAIRNDSGTEEERATLYLEHVNKAISELDKFAIQIVKLL
jgi:hypothetical protein